MTDKAISEILNRWDVLEYILSILSGVLLGSFIGIYVRLHHRRLGLIHFVFGIVGSLVVGSLVIVVLDWICR